MQSLSRAPASAFVLGAGLGALSYWAASALRARARLRASLEACEVYELKGQFYQKLGEAWDHEVKEFKVVYRPLYHCEAAANRFEAHVLAVSHFARWDERFRRVEHRFAFTNL